MSEFHGSYKGIGEMLCADFMVAEMRRRAEKVKALAESTAPDATPVGIGYKYEFEASAGVEMHASTSGKVTKRAVGTVTNTSEHALFVEFGGQNTPAHRTLGRALRAASD